ncbi:hypothetical protein pb186bvf_009603 [Paramecium bursaria]
MYINQGLYIITKGVKELKQLKYSSFVRNKYRKFNALRNQFLSSKDKSDKEKQLQFRNECFAIYSQMKQQLSLQQDLVINSEEDRLISQKLNYWMK